MANLLTVARVVLLFVVVGVWARDSYVDVWWLDLAMVALLAWVIFMDALDGWVARKLNEASDVGALLDIAGDRIVELVLWVFFAMRSDLDGVPLVAPWVPLVIITRTVITDLIRSVAFQAGKTPFGSNTMQDAAWARALTSSRWSRALYGGMKAVVFCALGLRVAVLRALISGTWTEVLVTATDLLVVATAVFCVVRAIPVIWDGRRYFGTSAPGLGEAAGGDPAPPSREPRPGP